MGNEDSAEAVHKPCQLGLEFRLVTDGSDTKNLESLDVSQINTMPFTQVFECFLCKCV